MNIFDKIRTLWILNREYKKVKEVVTLKSGWKTTEFWLTLASSGFAIWLGVQGLIPPETVVTIVAVATLVWTVARTIVKFTKTQEDDKLLAKLEKIFKAKKK